MKEFPSTRLSLTLSQLSLVCFFFAGILLYPAQWSFYGLSLILLIVSVTCAGFSLLRFKMESQLIRMQWLFLKWVVPMRSMEQVHIGQWFLWIWWRDKNNRLRLLLLPLSVPYSYTFYKNHLPLLSVIEFEWREIVRQRPLTFPVKFRWKISYTIQAFGLFLILLFCVSVLTHVVFAYNGWLIILLVSFLFIGGMVFFDFCQFPRSIQFKANEIVVQGWRETAVIPARKLRHIVRKQQPAVLPLERYQRIPIEQLILVLYDGREVVLDSRYFGWQRLPEAQDFDYMVRVIRHIYEM